MSDPTVERAHGSASDPRRSAVALALCLLVAVTLLGTLERLAAGRIDAARAARLADTLAAVLPDAPFDNDPATDRVVVNASSAGGDPSTVHRARLGDRPVGAVLNVVAADGYSGPIELLVGIEADGRVVGVRVTDHRETPGLGDRIERDRGDWITRFDGRAIDPDEPRDWRVVRGGANAAHEFDALSGATITSRAVVDAVHRALSWFERHRDEVFER